MRIACPECNAAYDVPAAQVGPGRPVRCARCGAVWTPVATEDARPPIPVSAESHPVPLPEPDLPLPEPEPEHPVPALPEPAFDDVPDPVGNVVPEPAPPRQRRGGGVPVLVGWLLTAFLLFVFAFLATVRRDAIVDAWPPAERAYRLVGLAR